MFAYYRRRSLAESSAASMWPVPYSAAIEWAVEPAMLAIVRRPITELCRPARQHGLRIVSPSAFAVFRLITSSNFVGCSTGRSAGFAPLRILST